MLADGAISLVIFIRISGFLVLVFNKDIKRKKELVLDKENFNVVVV
jgi:hypothetical protein